MYAQNAISVNEFLGHSWDKVLNNSLSNETLGVQALRSRGIFPEAKWYWIGFGALLGFIMLFNGLFTLALTYLKREFLLNRFVFFFLSFLLKEKCGKSSASFQENREKIM